MQYLEQRQFVRQSAMQGGLVFFAYLAAHCLLTVYGIDNAWCSAVSMLMLLAAPAVLLLLWQPVRKALRPDGVKFSLVFNFSIYTVFFATLLFTLGQMLLFKYVNPGFVQNLSKRAEEALLQMQQLNPATDYGPIVEQMQAQPLTAVDLAFSSAWLLIIAGVLWGLTAAAAAIVVERNNKA